MWPNGRFIKLSGVELPIIQAPMAGVAFSDMVVAVSQAGGLGSLACALLSVEQARNELETIRRKTSRPINANFFCHQPPQDDRARERNWIQRLDAYYTELQADRNTSIPPIRPRSLRRTNVRSRDGVSSRGRQLPFRSAG